MTRAEKLAEALRCCRQGLCEACPMQVETCDELELELEEIPTALLDRIEEELKDERRRRMI